VRRLLPDKVPGLDLERIELPPRGRMPGIPHTPGTREYLTCEVGALELSVGGEAFRLSPGDVVVFRGDQRHGYANVGTGPAVGYSVILLSPATA
jgi:quercetin dioxygenase-like cupin family protein